MSQTLIAMALGAVALVFSLLALWQSTQKKLSDSDREKTVSLQLGAYERLVLLSERIALPNLLSAASVNGTNAAEAVVLLTQTIRDEFAYNASQQIYVTPAAWQAVKGLKDQNLMMVHQVYQSLPADASASELSRALLQVELSGEGGSLHDHAQAVLNREAKAVMR